MCKNSFFNGKTVRKLTGYLRNILQNEKEFYGLVIGVFLGFLPIHGVQMMTAAAVAKIFRKSPIAAVIGTHVTNWWTTVPILYMNCKVGEKIISGFFDVKVHSSFSFILYTFTGGLIVGAISSLTLVVFRHILIVNFFNFKRKRIQENV